MSPATASPRRGPISTKVSRATARSAARRCRPRCAGPTRRSPSYRRRSTTCRCAPVNGEVGPIPAEQGELINAYSPLLTLVRLDDSYFVFNLREDILAKVRKGDRIVMQVPGLGGAEVETELRYIAPLGDFSTRRATRATGDFDLKTFETRFYPLQPTPGLRPGMSALWRWTN